MATKTRITLEEFLALPESKPYLELMDGEVIEKAMPNALHGGLVGRLNGLLWWHQQTGDYFHFGTEMRHIFAPENWVFLPDVTLLLKANAAETMAELPDPVPFPPDLAIEVLSPDERRGRVEDRVSAYARAGTTLLWIIDPERRSITVYRRGEEPVTAPHDQPLSAAPVLPGFELDIPSLFAVLGTN